MNPRDKAEAIAYSKGRTVTVQLRDPIEAEEQYNGRTGEIVSVLIDDAGSLPEMDANESILYTVEFDDGDTVQCRHPDVT